MANAEAERLVVHGVGARRGRSRLLTKEVLPRLPVRIATAEEAPDSRRITEKDR